MEQKNYVFLQDKFFLLQLDNLRIKELFVRITVLNWQEEPLERVQGKAINGSVNLDGNSSMRRTANLSLFAEEKDNNLANVDQLFSINKKCILELGIVNTVPNYIYKEKDSSENYTVHTINYQFLYGDIVWFPLGVYVMFNPSIAHSMDGVTISMQLKDKMCLLNGDLGGQIHSSVDFANQDEIVDENTSLTILQKGTLIYNIIKLLVNHWGNESLDKIIISEVPRQIKHVVKWKNKSSSVYVYKKEGEAFYTLDMALPSESATLIQLYKENEDIGYIFSNFTYPGKLLVCNAGDTVTSVLDKILAILGNYLYFYDVYGNFIFRLKQNYLNMTNTAYWLKEESKEDKEHMISNLPSDIYKTDIRLTKPIYNFIHNEYTTAYNNSLNFNNIKNDFVVWGYRKTINDTTIGCRYHLAIDKKPSLEVHNILLFRDSNNIVRGINEEPESHINTVTWLGVEYEIIERCVRQATDWREEIYYQMLLSERLGTDLNTSINNKYAFYYPEIKEEFPKIFDLSSKNLNDDITVANGWIDTILKTPSEINYFLDFIDLDSLVGQYSIGNIGKRSIIIDGNNEGINCTFEPEILDILYVDTSQYTEDEIKTLQQYCLDYGQQYTQVESKITNYFEEGGLLNSCYEKIKDLLYQYTHANNSISITTLPIYYLLPNTCISVLDVPSGIYGNYIIQSISLPLDVNSTMNINAYKALEKI